MSDEHRWIYQSEPNLVTPSTRAQEWDNSHQLCQGALPLKDDKHILLFELQTNHKSHAECWFNTKPSVCPAENQDQSNLIFSIKTMTILSLHHTTSLSTFLGFNGWGTGKAPAWRGNSEQQWNPSPAPGPSPAWLSKPKSSHSTLGHS